MHSFFTLRRIILSCIVLIAFSSGCTRITSTDVGSGLIPAIDGVITKDTLLDVITDTFDDPDSVRVYKSDQNVLGVITNDPLFGKSRAVMYFQMSPTAYPFYINGTKDSVVVDSAVLILSYRGMYGDSTKPLQINVFEISNNTLLDPLVNYPANYPSAVPVSIGQSLGNPVTVDIRRLTDSVNNRYENSVKQIRIRLRSDVAKRFIKDYDSTNAYKSDSIFKTYFAGFALTTNTSSPANALLKINLNDTNSKFALYYSSSSTGSTLRDTSVAYFRYTVGLSANANVITRDRSGSEVAKHITTTSKPDSLVYVQTMPGTYVRVRIPGLQGLSNRIVHRAELIAEQVPDDANLTTIETQMLPPRYLLLSRFDSSVSQRRTIPNDFTISTNGPNISQFGGFAIAKAAAPYDRIASYVFDLSRYVQGIVTRKDTSYTLRLSAPTNDSLLYTPPYPANTTSSNYYISPSTGNDAADGRVRLGGGTHSRFRMRLRVIYSRL